MRSIIAVGIVLVVTVSILVGLAIALGTIGSDGGSTEGPKLEPITIVTSTGDVARLDAEIADTEAEREVGLSGREAITDGTGMLFVFPIAGTTGFWMKDTLVPLSVAFLARCGEIIDIQDMQPLSLDIHHPAGAYNFGLEVPQGWFTAHGIKVGDLVSIPRGYRNKNC
jgi:uncharacterized membrane protein (UPF0127 family)